MKRLLCVLVSLALLFCAAPLGALAEGGVTQQNLDASQFTAGEEEGLPALTAYASPTPSQLAAQTPSQEDVENAQNVSVTLDTQALIDQAGVSPYGFLYPDTYCVLMDASTGRVLAE